jgi:ribosomal protein L3
MQQLLIGIILVLGLGGYWLYQENQTLAANNIALEGAVKEQQAAMEALKENYEKQGKALLNMSRKNAEIEADKAKYLSILTKHNFEKLAIAKPGLMEIRFNKGTEEVIKEIENDTKELFELNSSDDSN